MLQILRQRLHEDLSGGAKWLIALSGGVDSTALLHAMVCLGREYPGNSVRAVHIDHQLHEDSGSWAGACRSLCDRLEVPLIQRNVAVDHRRRDGIEAAARRARYDVLTELLASDEILLTAHHRDDQVETLLLRLLRGAGPHGLASIGVRQRCGRGWLVRPLLDSGRDELEAYAHEQQLSWVEDPANTDTAFDRNFLRHRVLPVLRERWPGLGATIPRAARLSGEAAGMLDELADIDLQPQRDGDVIPVDVLRGLSGARRRNVVRSALRRRGLAPPAEARLRAGLEQLMTAGPDRMPVLEWGGVQLRRYRDRLYIVEYDPDAETAAMPDEYRWDGRGRIELGPVRGGLRVLCGEQTSADLPRAWIVRFRLGGERFEAGGQHKRVKKLFQEQGIVPWMRAHVPLLYQGDRLVAVGDLWCAADIAADGQNGGARIVWDGHPAVL